MNYKSDIEIAQSCEMRHVDEIARAAHVDKKIYRTLRQTQGQNRPEPAH